MGEADDNPDQAQQIVAQELSLSLEVIQRAWPRHDWTAQLTPEVVQDIQAKADFLLNTDFIQNQVNASELVNTSFSQSNQQSQIIFTDPISLLPQLPIFPTLIPNAQ